MCARNCVPMHDPSFVPCLWLQEGSPDAAMEYLRCYFKDSPPPNHFLARAHLCKAIISAPQNHSELVCVCEGVGGWVGVDVCVCVCVCVWMCV